MLEPLTLESLAQLDGGRAAAVFQKHLLRAAQDCYDRPSDSTARKVIVEVLVTPVLDPGTNLCEHAKIQVKSKSAVPVHQTRVYEAKLKPNGTLLYNEDSPEAVDQGTLGFNEDDES